MINTKSNKYKETSKDSWMTSQTKPVNGNQDVIKTTVTMKSFGADSMTSGVYSKHPSSSDVIRSTKGKKVETSSSPKIELA